jgi:hypothetical protein
LDGVRPIKDAVKEFAEGPKRLEATLEDLTTFELDWRGDEAGWTIREIIHHMVDTDVRQTTHTKIALANSGSTMEFGWHPGNVSMAKNSTMSVGISSQHWLYFVRTASTLCRC